MDLYMKNQVNHQEGRGQRNIHLEFHPHTSRSLGDIVEEYAKRMKAPGSHVIGIRPTWQTSRNSIDEIYTMDQLDEVPAEGGFRGIHSAEHPAYPSYCMDDRRLRPMKPGVIPSTQARRWWTGRRCFK